MPDTTSADSAAAELLSLVQRIEHLEGERRELADMAKAVKAEAVAKGYDVKALAEVLRLRKMAREERVTLEETTGAYKLALGM